MSFCPDRTVRLVVYVPRDLHKALRKAAEEAGERPDAAIRLRLQSSLAVDEAKRISGGNHD